MKNYLKTILVTLLLTGTLISCKKDSASKDYSASIKDKTWWGTLTNAGENAQCYSVHFKTDGSLLWSQMSGDYAGKWTVNGKHLTMDFLTPAVQVKADISDDDKLMNIVTNTANKVNTGEMIEPLNILLDNTIWEGTMTSMNAYTLKMSFEPNGVVVITSNYFFGGSNTLKYSKSSSGVAIRIDYGGGPFFGVIVSSNEIKGNYNGYDWQVAKQ